MNLSKLNTYDGYNVGIIMRSDQRANCGDMPCAIYKLMECRVCFYDTKEELERIGKYMRGDTHLRYSFRHCVSWDKHIWAKRKPAYNCNALGRNLVGVLHGLEGDGVSVLAIKLLEEEVHRRIPGLLDLGELARIETKNNWLLVGKLLGTNSCAMDQFVNECIDLIDWVLNTLVDAKPKSPSGPFRSFAEKREREREIEECKYEHPDY